MRVGLLNSETLIRCVMFDENNLFGPIVYRGSMNQNTRVTVSLTHQVNFQ